VYTIKKKSYMIPKGEKTRASKKGGCCDDDSSF
jgi:hypothetical protein